MVVSLDMSDPNPVQLLDALVDFAVLGVVACVLEASAPMREIAGDAEDGVLIIEVLREEPTISDLLVCC